MSTHHRSILFLSGAGLPGWIWDGVRRRLGESYDTRVAPRPEGGPAGRRESGPRLRAYVEAALEAVAAGPVTIVAHSAGGVVGAEIARLAPERIIGFLGVSAIVPPPDGSFLTAMPIPNRWMLGAAMRIAGTRPPASAIRRTLAHGLDERTVDRLIADFAPESQAFYRDRTGSQPWTTPPGTAQPRPPRLGYATTTDDRELHPELQRRFAARLDAHEPYELATGHLPMLEDPGALATVIAAFLDPRSSIRVPRSAGPAGRGRRARR